MAVRSTGDGDGEGAARSDPELERIAAEHQHDLDALAARRLKVGAMLTIAMLVIYFGFILLIAFNKSALGELIADGLSWGMVLGVLVIFATWVLTWIYVGWANRSYEPEIQRLKAGRR
jgi:uncharacterized membrane protein (DUF485 family)